MNEAERQLVLDRYHDHVRGFDELADRRADVEAATSTFPLLPISDRSGEAPTAREIEVLQLIAEGLANREIGRRLFLAEETIKSHVRHLLAKLQARSRAQAVATGFRRGLIT